MLEDRSTTRDRIAIMIGIIPLSHTPFAIPQLGHLLRRVFFFWS